MLAADRGQKRTRLAGGFRWVACASRQRLRPRAKPSPARASEASSKEAGSGTAPPPPVPPRLGAEPMAFQLMDSFPSPPGGARLMRS